MNQQQPMTEDGLRDYLETLGARVHSRSGRSEHYGSPRDFSFEVRALFDNSLGVQIIARQYNYRDPWEAQGRINDLVDVSLLYRGQYSELPRGYPFFQGRDTEEGIDFSGLQELLETVRSVPPKLFELQSLTGDLKAPGEL